MHPERYLISSIIVFTLVLAGLNVPVSQAKSHGFSKKMFESREWSDWSKAGHGTIRDKRIGITSSKHSSSMREPVICEDHQKQHRHPGPSSEHNYNKGHRRQQPDTGNSNSRELQAETETNTMKPDCRTPKIETVSPAKVINYSLMPEEPASCRTLDEPVVSPSSNQRNFFSKLIDPASKVGRCPSTPSYKTLQGQSASTGDSCVLVLETRNCNCLNSPCNSRHWGYQCLEVNINVTHLQEAGSHDCRPIEVAKPAYVTIDCVCAVPLME